MGEPNVEHAQLVEEAFRIWRRLQDSAARASWFSPQDMLVFADVFDADGNIKSSAYLPRRVKQLKEIEERCAKALVSKK